MAYKMWFGFQFNLSDSSNDDLYRLYLDPEGQGHQWRMISISLGSYFLLSFRGFEPFLNLVSFWTMLFGFYFRINRLPSCLLIIHKGVFTNSCHYVNWVRFSNKWYNSNDHIIKDYPLLTSSKEVYLLFYFT